MSERAIAPPAQFIRRAPFRPARFAVQLAVGLARLGWWFRINKVYSPQYILWLLAILALLGAPLLLAATFALVDLVWLGAILLIIGWACKRLLTAERAPAPATATAHTI